MLSCINALAGEPGVTLLFTNGLKASLTFDSKPAIAVGCDGVIVSSTNTDSISYAFADVQRFYFEDNIQTGIQDVSSEKSSHLVFCCKNGTITVGGLNASENMSVFSANGNKAGESKADNDGCARVDISSATNGVYVITHR